MTAADTTDPAAGSAWPTAYRFGAFVIPLPEPLRGAVAGLRRRFDPRSADAAPPHITVTQPLREQPNDIAQADLGAVLAEFAPFDIVVGPARVFPDSAVVYFALTPAEPILALREAAQASGLFRLDLPFTEGFVPHVTIREWPDAAASGSEDVRCVADAAVAPTRIRVGAVELWQPDGVGRFGPVATVQLLGR